MRAIHKLSLLLAATLFAACSSEENEPMVPDVPDVPDTPAGEYARVRFTTAGDNAGKASTRAVWNDPTGSGSLYFSWEAYPEDRAGLVAVLSDGSTFLGNYTSATPAEDEEPKHASYLTVEPVAEEDSYSNQAKFETKRYYKTSEVGQATYVHAAAPFGDSGHTGKADLLSATAEMPAEFTQTALRDPSFLRDYMLMCGSAKMTDGSANIEFEHIPATFRFIVTNRRPGEATIKSVKISRDDGGNIGSTQLALTVKPGDTEIAKSYTSPCTAITTLITGENATLTTGGTYIAYTMALPLGDADGAYDNNAFNGKKIQFSIATNSEPANEYLSFVLDAELLAGANPNAVYNWVGGKSYTIRMSLSDVLTFEGITVTDWSSGGTVGSGEAEEAEQ